MSHKIFKKNAKFVVGVCFTVLEGLMASTVYMILYLLIDMLIKENVSYENITKLALLAAGIFIVRFIAYGIGYTQGQIGGGTLLKQIRIALGDKYKRYPCRVLRRSRSDST